MYAEQWNEYRTRRFMFWCVSLGGVPFVGLCWYLQDQIFPGSVSSPVSLAPAIAVVLAYGVAGIRLTSWRCPRCRKEYFVRGILVNQLASRCLHCGLNKWDEGETEKDERFYSKDERFYSK